MALIALLYGVAACLLAVYGANALVLTALFFRHRTRPVSSPLVADEALPTVTIQLPIYNEKYVAARLIDAVCALDYPRDRLQIQVLDDSTDETVGLIAHRVRRWRRRGVIIEQVRRPTRDDYKAGALRHGLASATGEFVAIFDADFVPGPGWLRQTVARFCQPGTQRLGLVQTRWSHLNDSYSPLTRAQALALDGHFGVEQAARASAGLLFNFNGTAGLWRRACIEQAGGWSGSTLSEDLDLSYRAQLAGWNLAYDATITAPAEIPAQVASFKRQQYRWAKGSMQVARTLGGSVLRAPLAPFQKAQAAIHLTAYSLHPLLILLLILTLPLLAWGWPSNLASHQDLVTWLSISGLGAPLLYAVAQQSLYGSEWRSRYKWMPLLVLLGTGVALSNAAAVLEGLFGARGGEFRRTPKFRLEGQSGSWKGSDYIPQVDWTTWGELALSVYALLGCLVAAREEQWFAIPFLLVYVLAFGWVAALSLWQARASTTYRPRPRRARSL
ncbi:MAG TPA: glycosyltransferase [Ardenticatenaceae bacterium]